MEIGNNEMSHKIRSAIKAKLVELGSYVDDELPDYIMVMIANKKSQAQMTDDLSLFLGSNTVTFTSWLHGVMEKLSKPAAESKPKKTKEQVPKSKKVKEKKVASPNQKPSKESETQPQPVKREHIASAAIETGSSEVNPSAAPLPPKPTVGATKAVKPDPSQDVITLKPEKDDFLEEELAQDAMASEMTKKQSAVVSPLHTDAKEESKPLESKTKKTRRKSFEGRSDIPAHPSVSVKISPTKPVTSRKRKAPGSVIGQVLNVEEEEDSDEASSFGKKVASTVLPLRRPTLPVAKQANTSLLKKAVSAAEASTSQALMTQVKEKSAKMAPRRFKIIRKVQQSASPRRNLLLRAVREAEESTGQTRQRRSPGVVVRPSVNMEVPASGLVSRSRQTELAERDYETQEFATVSIDSASQQVEEYYADDEDQDETEAPDSRHICMSTDPSPAPQVVYVVDEGDRNQMVTEPVYTPTPLAPESTQRKTTERSISPTFIVTLEGAVKPSKTKQRKSARVAPRLSLTRTIDNSMNYADFVALQQQQLQLQQQQQQKLLEVELARRQEEELALQLQLQQQLQQQQLQQQQHKQQVLQKQQQLAKEGQLSDDRVLYVTRKLSVDQDVEMQIPEDDYLEEEESSPTKSEKSSTERCMFWPACKNGSNCMYVHPTKPCRTFPNCKFGDKCLFIHPNCKYDSRCSRPNCPFTHATRKQGPLVPASPSAVQLSPPPVFVPPKVTKVCRFHPNCKNPQCTFLHPKMCLFGQACTRTGCAFTHPQVATGAALKWSKQTSISERPFVAKETSK